jgi:hypothetical protein
MNYKDAKEFSSNPVLKEIVKKDGPLKEILVEYVGKALKPEDNNITVEMIVETMAAEFPEFLLAVAEENWIRGYQQALADVDTGRYIKESHDKQEQNNKLHEAAE